MDTFYKLSILADSAKYDVSCSSSGSSRETPVGGIGNAAPAGVCHSWAADGRCISLLKVLYSNACLYDCAYCANKVSNQRERATFEPRELADIVYNFYRRNYIEGLFLSSAVFRSPDHTMSAMIRSVEILRNEYRFGGYIHLKAIPGAHPSLLHRAALLVDRMSANIELPSEKSLQLLAPEKTKQQIFSTMGYLSSATKQIACDQNRGMKHTPSQFLPAGQTTQLIVGATPETDADILALSSGLYKTFSMKRVYFSAYNPVNADTRLPAVSTPRLTETLLLREHRLYQADWLMRFYKFDASEILDERFPNLDPELDPKAAWALRHFDLFPVEVNSADYEMLLRVPGLGPNSAIKIVRARKCAHLSIEHLCKLGVVMKRAKYFITAKGKMTNDFMTTNATFESVRRSMISGNIEKKNDFGQQYLFPFVKLNEDVIAQHNNAHHLLN